MRFIFIGNFSVFEDEIVRCVLSCETTLSACLTKLPREKQNTTGERKKPNDGNSNTQLGGPCRRRAVREKRDEYNLLGNI